MDQDSDDEQASRLVLDLDRILPKKPKIGDMERELIFQHHLGLISTFTV